jgi:hypothetical protein
MKDESASQTGSSALKPLYTLRELVKLARMSRYRVCQLLEDHDVKRITAGRASYIPLSEIKEKLPTPWRSLCLSIEGQRAVLRARRS